MTMMSDTPPITTAVLIVSLSLLYMAWRKFLRHLESKVPFEGLPMSAGFSHWFFGHLGMFGNDFRSVHKRMFYDSADTNGVCSFWLMRSKGISVTRYQDARAILQGSVEHVSVRILAVHLNNFVGPRGIGTLNGKEWKFHRAAILRVFHSSFTLDNSREAMVNVTETLVDSLKKQLQPVQVDIEPITKMITLDIFGRTALTHDFGCCQNLNISQHAQAFDFLLDELMRRLRNPLWPPSNSFYSIPTPSNRRHAQSKQLIRDFLVQLIEERREQAPQERNPDLLTSLLRAHEDMKGQAPEEVTDQTLVDTMMSLLFAGYDTTSITLTYALFALATHPDVEEKCLEEITRVYKDDDSLTNPDRLVYCQGIITETLRMYPPGFVVSRNMTKPLQLSGGFVIPENTMVIIPIYMIQHDPKHFARPEDFVPERWVQKEGKVWVERTDSNGAVPAGNREALFAFSAGARSCAAQKFALQEAVLVMTTLIKDLKFAVPIGYKPDIQRKGIVQRPKGGMPMTISLRHAWKT